MKNFLTTVLVVLFTTMGFSQNSIKGIVQDGDGEALIGAAVLIEGTVVGTVTDIDGSFELRTSMEYPLNLVISYTGYAAKTIPVDGSSESITIALEQSSQTLDAVTVSAASRVDENILEAPVTIEKVDLTELRSTASVDAYGTLYSLKGVQANTGSLTFTSVNTRGFADMQNWRFVQLLDGMDASAPGLNYPVGGNSGPADIDIASMELVPGANSALYGANAFNGLLSIKTKSPFYYTGLSAYAKGGVTSQKNVGGNPLLDFGFRYAQNINDKFAYKLNFGYMMATDWEANDESHYVSNTQAAMADELRARPRNHPNYNATNVYGDEVVVSGIDIGNGETVAVNRTGIAERDIIDYDVNVIKGDASLHYRIADNVEASYGYRFIQSDGILRHTTIYPLSNFRQQFHRAELKGSNWNVKGFYSVEDAQDSYAMLVTGAFIEQGRKSNEDWGSDYGAAFRGEITGIAAGDHDAARSYADRDMPSVDSEAFQNLRDETLNNPNIATGGSKFIDNTSLISVDGNYDFTFIEKILNLQLGANYRRFRLDSEGQLFNDGAEGFGEPIPVSEFGAYIQAGKKLAKERLHLRGSIRMDKHQDFNVKFTPRISAVVGLDKKKKHNFRTSFQTGFRNPGSQEGYINLGIGGALAPTYLLGGIENNINNLTVPGANGPVSGADLHAGLVTVESFLAFLGGGSTDPSLLVPANLEYLKQEKNNTFEIGYKGIFGDKVLVDLNYYNTSYDDLVVRINTVSPATGRIYAVYTNVSERVTSNGFGAGIDYLIGKGYKAGINYTYTSFDATEAVENNPGFLPSFNTPKNRFNISFSGSSIAGSNFGFNIKYRYWDAYTWQSPFGVGDIDSGNVVDLALSYKIPKLQSNIKLGATNLTGNNYRTVYGGPEVGSVYYISWTYDQMFSK